jgi:tRNA U55 pseudouridine synthase TruB
MSFLLRKQVGIFSLQEAHTMEQLGDSAGHNKIKEFLLPLDYLFQESEKLFLHETEVNDLRQGRFLTYARLLEKYGEVLPEPVDETVLPVYTEKSVFTLLARWEKGEGSMFYLKPEKVLKSS